jgi:hypothetical protein
VRENSTRHFAAATNLFAQNINLYKEKLKKAAKMNNVNR